MTLAARWLYVSSVVCTGTAPALAFLHSELMSARCSMYDRSSSARSFSRGFRLKNVETRLETRPADFFPLDASEFSLPFSVLWLRTYSFEFPISRSRTKRSVAFVALAFLLVVVVVVVGVAIAIAVAARRYINILI